jgi:hypothetical protein
VSQEIDLELIAGGQLRLSLPPAQGTPACYVFSTECCAPEQLWQLIARLVRAAGGTAFALHDTLGPDAPEWSAFTPESLRRLLCCDGYAFGVFLDPEPVIDLIPAERPKLLFVRDPRDLLLLLYRSTLHPQPPPGTTGRDTAARPAPSLAQFLESLPAEHFTQRYRRYIDVWRSHANVTLLRYEYAEQHWRAIAAEIAAALHLPIGPALIASIADEIPPLADALPPQEYLDHPSCVALERRLAEEIAALGYARLGAAAARGQEPVPRPPAPANLTASLEKAAQLAPLFEPDPSTLRRLKPNASAAMQVLGRQVIMDVDESGCRPVTGQPQTAERLFWVYGCSLAYGIAVPAQETFCSLLQSALPTLRVENHGVPGFSPSRNLLQLERDARWARPELVTFCWIEPHLKRNVAAYDWIEAISKGLHPDSESPTQRMPRAALASDGSLQFRSVRVPRHDLIGVDLSDFAADPYYLDLVCLRLFERANALVTGQGGHFFITTLQGQLSARLTAWLTERAIPVVDAALQGQQYTCWPEDAHPNTLAHRIYSERIGEYVTHWLAHPTPTGIA